MAASVRLTLPNSRMFQIATLIVSSSFDEGIFAASMRFFNSSNPLAISGETSP
jgi:hypothetical protein